MNTAVLTGRQVSQAMKVFIVSQAGKAADVTLQSSCHSEDESVLKVKRKKNPTQLQKLITVIINIFPGFIIVQLRLRRRIRGERFRQRFRTCKIRNVHRFGPFHRVDAGIPARSLRSGRPTLPNQVMEGPGLPRQQRQVQKEETLLRMGP